MEHLVARVRIGRDPQRRYGQDYHEDLGDSDGHGHVRRTRLLEHLPNDGLEAHVPRQVAVVVVGMRVDAELYDEVLLRGLNDVDVEAVEGGERLGRGRVLRMSHPAARLHVVGVQAPELELFGEQRSANVERIVQLARAIVVEYLREDARVSVEEVLVGDRIVVDERLGETREARRRYFLQYCLVGLEARAAHVQNDSILEYVVFV